MTWPSWKVAGPFSRSPEPEKTSCQCPRCGDNHKHVRNVKTIKARGVGRDGENPRGVVLYFDRPLTNEELIALHEQEWVLPEKPNEHLETK